LITIAQNTRIEYEGGALTSSEDNESLVLERGKIRFDVKLPNGIEPIVKFKTAVAMITAGGSVGDISLDSREGLRVNLYSTHKPITIDSVSSERVALCAGKTAWIHMENGKAVVTQGDVTNDIFQPFGSVDHGGSTVPGCDTRKR
jgi:hypothetical protein